MSKLTENLLSEIKEGRAIYGSKVALKHVKKNNVDKVYITNDCPKEIESKLKESNANILTLDITKEMLKDLCKTPFNVSVVSIIKEGKELKERKEKSGEKIEESEKANKEEEKEKKKGGKKEKE